MKSNKKIIGIVFIIAIILLGIGYAAITSKTLTISGTASATANSDNFKVKFTGTPEVSDSNKVTATVTNDTTATIAVTGLTKAGDKAKATYTIKNVSEGLSASVTASVTAPGSSDYFSVTTDWATAKTIAADGTETIEVTVELLKTPIEDKSDTITVELKAEPVEIK